MNCKPGDLAMVVKGRSVGVVCTCIRLASIGETLDLGYDVELDGPMWVTDKSFQSTWGDWDCLMFDDFLRPLRDPGDDAVDEMVERVGKPEGIPA